MAPTNAATRAGRPRRPKRAPTGYNIFMKKFMKSQCITSRDDAKNAIKAGAKLWGKMSGPEKEKYGKQSTKYRVQHEAEMSNYRRQLQAFKAPPRPFIAFLQDYYNGGQFEQPGDRRNIVSELGRSASVAWHNLKPNQRLEYTRHFQTQYQDHKLRLSGGTVLLDVQNSPTPTLAVQVEPNRSLPSTSTRKTLEPQGPRASARNMSQRNPRLDITPISPPVLNDERLVRKSARIESKRRNTPVKKNLRFRK
ncbi:unnamed protein product [Allacma fusca]|uniref:HMG box domain-containing protein n=1 Tax=Allacma fusca TaxID=39272 RepID=A0A8J2JF93_9HEXA|nr:unnamed protein product [Allacma fusca]